MQSHLQPTAIYHAFDEHYTQLSDKRLKDIAQTGYSHIQIAPAQKSNPAEAWWARYQPVNYSVIEGRGSEADLQALIQRAHRHKLKIIADVVFNHMANLDGGEEKEDLSKFPGLTAEDFHTLENTDNQRPGSINYQDGNTHTELYHWLGGLPDLKHTDRVIRMQTRHLKILMDMGIDGFRFDAAKHIPPAVLQHYIDFINVYSAHRDHSPFPTCWNYLEVITDNDTKYHYYNRIAAISDFNLYYAVKSAFSYHGNLKTLKHPNSNYDSRSVTFGRNHDTIKELNDHAIAPYSNTTDSYLASAYILSKSYGTPLVMNMDDADCAFIRAGVKYRQIITDRMRGGYNVREMVLDVCDSPNILFSERGTEGFCIINKATEAVKLSDFDLSSSQLSGNYRELRYAYETEISPSEKKLIPKAGNSETFVIKGREALFFIKI